MRWSIIRVIWLRELRGQLRDRRTMFMIAVRPLPIYPLGALGLIQLAPGLLPRQSNVGIAGASSLPRPAPPQAEVAAAAAWLAAPGPGRLLPAAALAPPRF